MMIIMRYSDQHKDNVRARIVAATAEAIREQGVQGVSIPALMRRVGLTHGAFYAHFESRDALVAEAVRAAATESAEHIFGGAQGKDVLYDAYLSAAHAADPAHGCVVAALGAEGSRQPVAVRQAFADAARGLLRRVEFHRHRKRPRPDISIGTLNATSLMVGAVTLARLVDDKALAARILAAARAELVDS
ncbi:MAG: helix-turn-helix domain-containing protein [bacterium]